ncbi:MAG TPA: hypothetical protein VEZ20_09725 [Allosphingosinicella sp.]|nr:hypothetical protein [Allosphingosinicella sp.]
MTRRHLLAGLGAGLIGGAAPALAAPVRGARTAAADLARGGMSDWAAHVGTRFAIAGGGTLRLVSVEPLCSGGPTPARSQCFAATFEAAGGAAPEGGATVFLAAPGAGAMPLYLGPRSAAGGRFRLVAVFN